MMELGEVDAAVQLLADVAHRARTLACEIIAELTTQASLLSTWRSHKGLL